MKFCPNCGAKVAIDNAKFCMECGTSFKDFVNKANEPIVEEPQDDFFAEAVENNTLENDSGFFSDMGEAVKKEDNANNALIEDATRYFLQGDVRRAETVLSDIKSKDTRVRHMLATIYQTGGDGFEADDNKAIDITSPNDDDKDIKGILCVNFFNHYCRSDSAKKDPMYNDIIRLLNNELPKAERDCKGPFDEYELGFFYVDNNQYRNIEKGKMYLERASSHDMWPAQFILGTAYENGLFGKIDYNKAYRYYEKSAKKGMAIAAQSLGTMLYWGNGCNENHKEAKKWYLIGAKQNDPLCVHQVGVICEEEGNYSEAIKWLEKAVSLPDNPYLENACAELGTLLINGNDDPVIPTNHIRGFQLIQKALSINPKNGQALLGLAMAYACEDIPEMANVEPEQRLEMFKRYCNEAMKYSEGAIREEARSALAHLEKMERESANQQNSEGCFITTAVCDRFGKDDDCYELTMFRDFRDNWLAFQDDGKSLIKEYYIVAPKIVSAINQLPNARTIYREIWDTYLEKCLSYIEQAKWLDCKEKYVEMVQNLRKKYTDN
ncbi:MAG: zinc-ribbon domain-containing protein [Selenomonas ruminantium]|jgi:TPR repeat protein|uniref:Zinc-ribbon domain-containing protein n=1 Tax=Selenomonas ruminantium TaxID=971 RepID=A0A927WJI2_SELRU|nr:CFI-box-CTERM domain-containing protein [Selenomonas ruminantium]MBE6085911.1 zinc-ribbon domain-containing protein [Selenomonas ruminantium]